MPVCLSASAEDGDGFDVFASVEDEEGGECGAEGS